MQKIHIQNEAVRRNIALFQQIVRRMQTTAERHSTYRAFVNRKTGTLRFAEGEGMNPEEWKSVTIHLDLDSHTIEIFEADPRMQKEFDKSNLHAAAYRILSETLQVLQKLVRTIQTLREIAQVEIEPSLMHLGASDLIHEAWHQVDRKGAEALLLLHSPGTYLFRKDEYAAILEHELFEALHAPVKCVTLSYVDAQRNVHDKTIIRHCEQWMFYDDDPSLTGPHYESISALLGTLTGNLTKPLIEG